MGRLNQLLPLAKEHFDDGEEALAAVVGQYETKRAGTDANKTGIMIATDRRVLFFAKRLFGYQLEHFPYRAISSFEQGARMMGSYIKFFASGNEVSLKWIAEGDVEVFAATVRKGMAEGTATRVVAKKAIAPKPPKRRTHWLAYVLGLALVVPILGLTLAAGFAALIAGPADDPAPRPQVSGRSAPTAKTDPSVTRSQQAKSTRSSAHPANPFAPIEPLQYDNTLASDGQVLYEAIVAKNPELYRFYKEESLAPITDEHSVFRTDGWSHGVDISGVSRGFAAMIALSEESWNGLSDSQRDSLGHFLTRESPDTGWVVYVGEVKRIDSRLEIMGDRTPMSSREWDWKPTP